MSQRCYDMSLGVFGPLFDHVANLRCVVKDRRHRYLYVNRGWLESVGIGKIDAVLGRTAADLFPAWQAERYLQEEREVFEHGRCFDYEEMVRTRDGERRLWRSIKAPWMRGKRIAGMVNIGVLVEREALGDQRADVMPRLVDWMARHACEAHSITSIAEQSNMSRRTLERYFIEKTGQSPVRYRSHCRIEHAKSLLEAKAKSLTEVAMECGFCDQSHFTRVFRAEAGCTPRQWRMKKQSGPAGRNRAKSK